MTEQPLVSIIIPSYNHMNYIEESIMSALNQTYDNIELIVIDDGSKDDSVAVIKKMADKHGFKFIHRENRGLSATLNEGINIAQGKYINTIASDDKLFNDKIEKQVRFMEDNPQFSMCYGKVIAIDNSGKEIKWSDRAAKQGWVYKDLLISNFIPAASAFIRKDVIEAVGGYDVNICIEDRDMWLRIAQKYQIGYLDEYLAYYRQHDTNMSKNVFEMYLAQKQIFEKHKTSEFYDEIMRRHKKTWFRRLSRSHKAEALKYLPSNIRYIFTDLRVLKAFIKLLFYR